MASDEFSSGVHGNYRLDDSFFPTPATSWEEQRISVGLNGIAINSSYKIHKWNWAYLDAELAKELYSKFNEQQASGVLEELETDSYDAELSPESYGTEVYTDFTMLEVSARSRSLSFYENVTLTMEVYVS